MTIAEAFKHFLENKAKDIASINTRASWKKRFNEGRIADSTMRTLLIENGYTVKVSDEDWHALGDPKEYTFLYVKENKFKTVTLSEHSYYDAEQAATKECKGGTRITDITGKSIADVIKTINEIVGGA